MKKIILTTLVFIIAAICLIIGTISMTMQNIHVYQYDNHIGIELFGQEWIHNATQQ